MSSSVAIDAVRSIGTAQFGLFTVEQATAAGMTRRDLSYQMQARRQFRRVLPRVYALAGATENREHRLFAAQLWAEPAGGVLSHRSAAYLMRLDGFDQPAELVPDITGARARSPATIKSYRRRVTPDDVTMTRGFRHTTALRTIIDLALVVDGESLEHAVESGLRLKLVRESDLVEAAAGDWAGARRLRRVLARRPAGAPPTDSMAETLLIQAWRGTGLPAPVRQYAVLSSDGRLEGRADLVWHEARLWVEVDGSTTHNVRALNYDNNRQNRMLLLLPYHLERLVYRDVAHHPRYTVGRLRRIYLDRLASLGEGTAATPARAGPGR